MHSSTKKQIQGCFVMTITIEKKSLKKSISYETETDYLRSIIEKLPNNIFWKKKNGQFLGCNETVAKILNLSSPTEIIGKTNYDLFDQELARMAEEVDQKVMQSGKAITTEEIGLNENGEQVVYLSSKVPLFDQENNIFGILGTATDISKIKEAEKRLKESNEQLRKLDRSKTEFINNMQHDLRTPLTGLYAIMDILRREENNNPERAELFELGFSAAEELLAILDEFVDFSKYDTDGFAFTEKKFNLKKTIEQVINLEALRIKQKGLELRFDYDENCPIDIISDEHRIRGILINLLGNAVKFTTHGFIEIKVMLVKKADNHDGVLVLQVKDTGKGIPKEYQQDIFEKFRKIDVSNTGSYRGMGMGLYLARRFIEELSGKLYLTSELDKGSEFSCTVPVKIP
jgi:PAS domain S-box-containing protein